jgi:hypothetical protein
MYLSNFGYLDPMLTNISSTALIHVSNEAYRRGIAEFQSFVGLDQTGDQSPSRIVKDKLLLIGIKFLDRFIY